MLYTGLTGKVIVNIEGESNPPEIAYISNWSVESTTDVIEITRLGKEYKEKLPGLQGWSASADGAVCFDTNKSQNVLFKAKKEGLRVDVSFYLDHEESGRTGSKDVFFSGKGYIESLSVDLSAEDKGNISISIAGDGELTLSEVDE